MGFNSAFKGLRPNQIRLLHVNSFHAHVLTFMTLTLYVHCPPFTKTQPNTNKCIQLVASNQPTQCTPQLAGPLHNVPNPANSTTVLFHLPAVSSAVGFLSSQASALGASIWIWIWILNTDGKIKHFGKAQGKAIPIQAWTGPRGSRRLRTGPRGSRRLRIPDFMTGGTWRRYVCQSYAPAAFTPKKYSWYWFLLETESTPGP